MVDGLPAGHAGSHRPQGSRGCVRSTVTVHRATRGPARGEQQLRELQTNSLTFADGGHDDGSFRVFDFCSSSPAPRVTGRARHTIFAMSKCSYTIFVIRLAQQAGRQTRRHAVVP